MHVYSDLDRTYRQLTARRTQPDWLAELGDLDAAVATIRNDHPNPTGSDAVLRRVIILGRHHADALTVALHALAPALARRIGRAVTDDYRADALADLTFVLLDSPLDGTRLAHRCVNRAHNRTHKATRRVHQRGVVHPTTITPQDPEQLARRVKATCPDIADTVARAVDLGRFHTAVRQTIADGHLPSAAWDAYRDHRLRRAVDPSAPVCDGNARTTAIRTARKLQPLIDTYLHAA